jgi:ornithine cyclodeaminase
MIGEFAVYRGADVRRLLDYDGCIRAVRAAMAGFTAAGGEQPLRSILRLGADKVWGLMPGALPAPDGFGAKIVTAFADPQCPGRSQHQGVVVVFDRESGAVVCVADAGELTKIRTAAASAVATDMLARRDASRLAIFGYGAQAETHLRAIARVRRLEEVLIWGRSLDSAARFAARMAAETGLTLRAVADARDAAESADIICTVTSASTPILLGAWVRPGTHVNTVGSSYPGPVEIDSDLVVASRYIADSRRSALAAAAEFLLAKQAGLIDDAHIVAEIGEVLLGRASGRTASTDITLYKSLGHIVQDLAAATYVHARATGAARA